MGRTRLVLGVCGGCQLGSSFSFLHTGFGSITNMVSLGDNVFSLAAYMEPLYSAFAGTHGTDKIFYSSWTNYRLLMCFLAQQMIPLLIVDGLQTFDVLPSPTADSSTHRGRTADILMCCPTGVPNFFRSIDASAIFSGRNTHDRRTFFS
ncbi:hypothetical protein TNCV_2814351 [Trichonephila clavipes]|nr:hypothetical protein TNCV_2814351 [Trichonephila clavipes]